MKSALKKHQHPSAARVFVSAAIFLCGAATAQELLPTKPSDQKASLENPLAAWDSEYTNWFEVSVGNLFVNGSDAAFQRRYQMPAGVFGGVESFHLEQTVLTNTLLKIDGRGIFDNHDYELSFDLSREKLGYVRAGYREFRTWYDLQGGFLPPNIWVAPFDREVAIDRGQAWFEAGLRKPDLPEITFRYEHDFREGNKDSTSWGDFTIPGGARRNIVPSFYGMDETRDSFQLSARHTISSTELSGALTYELIHQDDEKFILRTPGQATERYVTQNNASDTDLFNAHVSTATQINPHTLFTAGYSFTLMEEDMSGSRIYGSGFEAVYDPTFRRQVFDEGFLNLDGSGTFHEHLFNTSVLFTPWANLSIVPALRVSKQDESADSLYLATNLEPGAPPSPSMDLTSGANDRDYLDVAESLELRYTGLTNWVLYTRGEWSEDQGDLRQHELNLLTGDEDLLNEDADRFTQKYVAGANWYPLRRVNLGAQYYHKIHDYTYENRLGPPPTAYPGFLQRQNFDTDDANFRLTLRPLNSLTLVTRYDFQLSTIDTLGDSLQKVQSAKITSHIISQSGSWTPFSRLYLQGTFNFVLDQTETPADPIQGAAQYLVLRSDNNYWDVSALVGIAVDTKTDLQFQYVYYRADDYWNNAAYSVPYGAGQEENGVTATLMRQLTKSLRWTLKYGFFSNHDQTYGGHNNYGAHLVYSSVQYRF